MNRNKDCEVFVGGIPQTCNRDDFYQHFQQFGALVKCDFKDGKGYGFITYEEPDHAMRAIEAKGTIPLQGKHVDVKPAENRARTAPPVGYGAPTQGFPQQQFQGPPKKYCIFVGGLPPTCHAEKFRQYFEKWGRVLKADFREGKGYGFVTFESGEVMEMVLANREQHTIDGKWVDCKSATDKRDAAGGAGGAPAPRMMFDAATMASTGGDPTAAAMMDPASMMMDPTMMMSMMGMTPEMMAASMGGTPGAAGVPGADAGAAAGTPAGMMNPMMNPMMMQMQQMMMMQQMMQGGMPGMPGMTMPGMPGAAAAGNPMAGGANPMMMPGMMPGNPMMMPGAGQPPMGSQDGKGSSTGAQNRAAPY